MESVLGMMNLADDCGRVYRNVWDLQHQMTMQKRINAGVTIIGRPLDNFRQFCKDGIPPHSQCQ